MRAPLLCRWLARHYVGQHREPDFIIGGKDDPYLRRWFVIPRNRHFNIYLHHIRRSDDDRALHDHPWASLSFCLKGAMSEVRHGEHYGRSEAHFILRNIAAGDVTYRSPTFAHRLIIDSGDCWTLFITGPIVRQWGFHCPKGWRHWKEFVSMTDPGLSGPGCD